MPDYILPMESCTEYTRQFPYDPYEPEKYRFRFYDDGTEVDVAICLPLNKTARDQQLYFLHDFLLKVADQFVKMSEKSSPKYELCSPDGVHLAITSDNQCDDDGNFGLVDCDTILELLGQAKRDMEELIKRRYRENDES